MTLVTLSATAHAQYLFRYAVWGDYTQAGDGYPFNDPLCSGVTPVINYDNNPLTSNPKIQDWCPEVGPTGDNFGAQFAAVLYAFTSGDYSFYAGSDDGSGLYIDGTQVMALAGEQPFTSNIVSVWFDAGTYHSYLLDYYANPFGGSAVQAVVDGRLDVSAAPADFFDYPPDAPPPVTSTPDVPPLFLVGTAFGSLGLVGRVRRWRLRRAA
ncbi:MAG: hypothetical protein ACREPM_11455 [Gemmatimonadaceae bacterium]